MSEVLRWVRLIGFTRIILLLLMLTGIVMTYSSSTLADGGGVVVLVAGVLFFLASRRRLQAVVKNYKWTPEAVARWERVRLRGRGYFVWFWNVFAIGFTTLLIMSIVIFLFDPRPLRFFQMALMCLLGSYIAGRYRWGIIERSYQQHLADTNKV